MKTVAIIGGGFSGTMVAVNLARMCRSPLKIIVINRGCPAGRGVAYSTPRAEHLLNVAARNMSAFPDYPDHLLEWLRTRTEYADVPEAELRDSFIPRRVFGDYLKGISLHYSRPVDALVQTRVEHIEGEVDEVVKTAQGAVLRLNDGAEIAADRVVLALGNQPPAAFPGAESLAEHPAYCANPWRQWYEHLPDHGGVVVLLGTGLTSVDAILTLLECGWQGKIVAVSRNGLLPRSHFRGIDYPDFPPPDPASLGLEELKSLIEEHCARLESAGQNPAIVVDKLRPHTQEIWQRWSTEEKREFCSRHAARWNVIRHRIAPQIHERITRAQDEGMLEIVKGSILSVEDAGAQVRVALDGGTTLDGDLVINATGPMTRFSATAMPLIQNLLAGGLAQPDEMDMGIRVTDDLAVIDASGDRSNLLFALGPLLRGTLWETIAVPELRGQALRVAQALLSGLEPGREREESWPTHKEEAVMEYMI